MCALTKTHSPATLCTLARLLANLALDPLNIPRLQDVGVVRELSHALFFQTTSSDIACKLSILRAVRLLSSSSSCREEVKNSEGLLGLINCLKSSDEAVAVSALHTLQVLATNTGLPCVVHLCSHSNSDVSRRAVEVLVACAKASEGRVSLSNAGGVERLLQQLDELAPGCDLFPPIATALCASCRDVLGRQHMRDSGGLERLIQMLSSSELAPLHGDILSALVCYYFDEHSLKFMVKGLGLLKALTYHLQQMATCQAGNLEKEEGEEEEERCGKQVRERRRKDKIEEGVDEVCEEEIHNVGKEEAREDTARIIQVSVIADYSSPSPPASHNDSPALSGFDANTSPDRSSPVPLPSSESREEGMYSTNHGSFSGPRCDPSNPSPSPPSWSSPSCPSSLSPSPPDEVQPLPKRPRLCSEVEFSQPMPANFLDSLLSSPSPYQTPSRQPEAPMIPDPPPSLERHVVQLLSRVSHLRDCLCHLASHEVLQALLAYFLSSTSSLNTHIFKTLSRIFASPHCFQEVVSCHIPSKLYEQLYLTPPPSAASLDSSTLFSDEFDLSSPLHALPSPTYTYGHRPSLSSTPPLLPCNGAGLGHMCQELLCRLSHVGESPYGQGVLAHLLLAGDNRDKTASALAAPLLCRCVCVVKFIFIIPYSPFSPPPLPHTHRVPRVCQRLMVDYNGQKVLVQQLATPSPALRGVAADALLVLASTADLVIHRKLRHPPLNSSGSDTAMTTSPGCHTPRGPVLEPSLFLSPTGMECRPRPMACRYHDSDHCPFDYVVMLHWNGTKMAEYGTGTQHTVRMPVHKTVLMEASEVFNGMLGGHFIESGKSEVILRDVHPLAFQSVLHHMYGCGWQCKEATSFIHSKSHDQSCDQQNVSDSIMAVVSSNFDLPDERADVLHTLRCLGTASQFLLSSLCSECERRAASFLSPATAVPLFLFSQLHQSCWLAEECVRHVVALPPSLQRRSCLLELAQCAEGDTALDMLQRLIATQLHVT